MASEYIPNLSIKDYHNSGLVSWSGLHEFIENPALYKAIYVDKTVPKRPYSDALRIGHAYEDMLCFKGVNVRRFAKDNWRGKEADQFFDDTLKQDLIPVNSEEYDEVAAMVKATHENSVASDMVRVGFAQATYRATIAGITMQTRPDLVIESNGELILVNIKSTYKSLDEFPKQAAELLYHYGEVFSGLIVSKYNKEHGIDVPIRHKFLVCTKEKVPQCQVMELPESAIEKATIALCGTEESEGHITRLIKCLRSGNWPKIPEVATLELPSWSK